MRRSFALGAGLLLALATWSAGRAPAQKDAPARAIPDKLGVEGWQYPGTTAAGSTSTTSFYHATMSTPDDLDKVVAFYEKKTGRKLVPEPRVTMTGSRSEAGAWYIADHSREPDGKTARPVVVRALAEHRKAFSLTLVISRATGEKHTHVFVSYYEH